MIHVSPGSRALLRFWAVSLAAWSMPALLETTQSVIQSLQAGSGATLWQSFLRFAPKYYLWALLTPVAWNVARRFPLHDSGRRLTALLTHAGAALALSAVHLLFTALYFFAFWNTTGETLGQVLGWYYASVFGFELLVYAIVVGAYHLFHYQHMVREHEVAAARLEVLLAQARFDALQRRLHPHFLFNALNAFVGMLRYDRTPEAIRAIGELGHLLRDALDESGGQERSLEEELEWAERYLAIERLRMGPRLKTTIDVADDVLDAPVPRLLLQPLVENAIHHGIAPCPAAGEVRITAVRDDDRLRIEVLDDGNGPPVDSEGGGLGLENTRARLSHLYGASQSLTLTRRSGGGARATVELPLRSGNGAPPAARRSEPVHPVTA